MNVVLPVALLLGLLASSDGSEQTVEPIPLEPDSTGTRYIAPVQIVRGERIRPGRRLDRQPGMASVLEAENWAGQGLDPARILGRASGLSVSSTGGLGAAASVRVRGSTPAQVPVYLDGVLVNRPDHQQ